jgi:ubiquinone biosynthesis protein COQ9
MQKNNLNDLINQEKSLILTKFLKEAAFEGWNKKNLLKSTQACGFSPNYALVLFPGGIAELTENFSNILNEKMTEEFLSQEQNNHLPVGQKIAKLIELKFKLYAPHHQAIQSLLQYNMLPQNFLSAQKLLWQTCDQIWYLAGDRSTDHNYYTKRSILAGIYSSSLLYWLSDESKDYLDTKDFIKRKIANVLQFGKWKRSILNRINSFCSHTNSL